MKVEDLEARCRAAEFVLLVLPRKVCPRGLRARFLGNCGPYGEILNVKEAAGRYEVCARFKSSDILDFIEKVRAEDEEYQNRDHREQNTYGNS